MKSIVHMLWAKTRFDENVAQLLNDVVHCPNFDHDVFLNSLLCGHCHGYVNALIEYACLLSWFLL